MSLFLNDFRIIKLLAKLEIGFSTWNIWAGLIKPFAVLNGTLFPFRSGLFVNRSSKVEPAGTVPFAIKLFKIPDAKSFANSEVPGGIAFHWWSTDIACTASENCQLSPNVKLYSPVNQAPFVLIPSSNGNFKRSPVGRGTETSTPSAVLNDPVSEKPGTKWGSFGFSNGSGRMNWFLSSRYFAESRKYPFDNKRVTLAFSCPPLVPGNPGSRMPWS